MKDIIIPCKNCITLPVCTSKINRELFKQQVKKMCDQDNLSYEEVCKWLIDYINGDKSYISPNIEIVLFAFNYLALLIAEFISNNKNKCYFNEKFLDMLFIDRANKERRNLFGRIEKIYNITNIKGDET